jgi:hypothetical protein
MSEPERPRCKTCPYWDRGNNRGVNMCLRFPPRSNNNGDVAYYPETIANDTCGEHPDFPAYIVAVKLAEGATP